jgi:hypothetical protein
VPSLDRSRSLDAWDFGEGAVMICFHFPKGDDVSRDAGQRLQKLPK